MTMFHAAFLWVLLPPAAFGLFLGFGGRDALVEKVNRLERLLPAIAQVLRAKRSLVIPRFLLGVARVIYGLTAPLPWPRWRAAARVTLCLMLLSALLFGVGYLAAILVIHQDDLLPYEVLGAPVLLGLAVGFLKPTHIVKAINDGAAAAILYFRGSGHGVLLRFTLDPALWLYDRLYRATERSRPEWAAAIRLAWGFYLAVLAAIALGIALIIGFFVLVVRGLARSIREKTARPYTNKPVKG
jgi:hypothetical protein